MFTTTVLLLVATTLCHSHDNRYLPHRRPNFGDRPPLPYPPKLQDRDVFFPRRNEGVRSSMEVLFSWRQLDFMFPNENMRQTMLQNGQFIPRNNLILDVDIYDDQYGRKVFVTIPRVRPGVPVTLAVVSSELRNGANLLAPYPDWLSQVPGDCQNGLTSVFRTHIDQCGRLWVLDSGNNNAFAGNTSRIVCPPQVLIYDLRNYNRLIGKFRIPSSMIEENSLLVTIVVDTRSSDCSDSFAYIADALAYRMIVFNLRTQEFWRINNVLFQAYPDQSSFSVNGVSFNLSGGIFGLALGPVLGDRRRLFFHCIASVRQSWVETDDVRDPTLYRYDMNGNPRAFNLYSGTRSSQSAAAAMSEEGIMFFGLIGSNEMACWNSQTDFEERNIVSLDKNDTTLQFNSGIKVYGDKLYTVTNRLQNYLTNQVNENEINYRVLVGDVRQMTKGTLCEVNPLGY